MGIVGGEVVGITGMQVQNLPVSLDEVDMTLYHNTALALDMGVKFKLRTLFEV